MQDEFTEAMAAIDTAARKSVASEQAAKILSQARVDLVMGRDAKAVFFATVAMRMRLEESEAIDTAATDGRRIVYNPTFIAGLNRKQAVGLLAHEVLHVTNVHHARMGDRELKTWNVACDLAINPLLKECGIDLPDCGIFPGEGAYAELPAGESAEAYYAALQNAREKQRQDGGDAQDDSGDGDAPTSGQDDPQDDKGDADPGRCGGVMKPGKGSEAECRQAEAEAKEMAAAAEQAVHSSGRGDLPGGLGHAVRELLEPKADWRAILREFVAKSARNDYSWTRPNRRFIHAGLYLPGLHSEELGEVVVALDTSGSIGAELLQQFCSEVQGILEAYDCTLTILYHHSDVYKVQQWRTTDGPLVLEQTESGGTSHVPVFGHIEDHQIDVACIVCLTDLESTFPVRASLAPTLWVKVGTGGSLPPFGRVVDLVE
jgi:predicted metal-dependent peptidase